MVTDYYCNIEPFPGDLVFDTSQMKTSEIADEIISYNE
jgi:hypothetical protein